MALYDQTSGQVVSFGTGADGALSGTPTIGTRGTATVKNYTSVNCTSITILGAVTLLVQGACNLGTVLGNGGGANGGADALNAPGSAGHNTRDSGSGFSWGCGGGGGATAGANGAGSPHDGTANDGGGGVAYSTPALVPFTEGAGGGGDFSFGQGGASLCVQAPSITWTSISLKGANGRDSGSSNNGGTGGGGGGQCWLRTLQLQGGTIDVSGGSGGTGVTQFPGGNGSAGRVRLDRFTPVSLGTVTPAVGLTTTPVLLGATPISC